MTNAKHRERITAARAEVAAAEAAALTAYTPDDRADARDRITTARHQLRRLEGSKQ